MLRVLRSGFRRQNLGFASRAADLKLFCPRDDGSTPSKVLQDFRCKSELEKGWLAPATRDPAIMAGFGDGCKVDAILALKESVALMAVLPGRGMKSGGGCWYPPKIRTVSYTGKRQRLQLRSKPWVWAQVPGPGLGADQGLFGTLGPGYGGNFGPTFSPNSKGIGKI